MFFSSLVDYLETDTQDLGQLGGGVTSDRQTRTELRPIRSERGHNDTAAWKEGRSKHFEIELLVTLLDEEMEHRSVVPQFESTLWAPCQEILMQQGHRGAAQALTHRLQSQL